MSPGQSELHSETLPLKKGTEPGGRSKEEEEEEGEREERRRKEEGRGRRGKRTGEEEGWVRERQYGAGDMFSRESLGPQSLLPHLLPGWHKVNSLLDHGFTGGPKSMVQTSHGQEPQA